MQPSRYSTLVRNRRRAVRLRCAPGSFASNRHVAADIDVAGGVKAARRDDRAAVRVTPAAADSNTVAVSCGIRCGSCCGNQSLKRCGLERAF